MVANQAVSFGDSGEQPVAIVEVDLVKRTATGFTRRRSNITIDLRYHVGGMQITPAYGEQWFVSKADSFHYRLIRKVPFNAPEMNVEPVEGMTQIGSSGPTIITGSTMAVPAVELLGADSDARPDASDFKPGTMIYDFDLKIPVFSDGSIWRDAAGDPV